MLAIAATLVLSSAGLDLSLGSVLAVAGVVAGVLGVNLGLPWPLGIAGGLLAGMLLGAVNGLLIARAGIPAFIVTLGMLSAGRGLALLVADGKPVYGLPAALTFLGQGRLLGVPLPVWIDPVQEPVFEFAPQGQVDGLEQVALALRVAAHDRGKPRRRGKLRGLQVAKVGLPQAQKAHSPQAIRKPANAQRSPGPTGPGGRPPRPPGGSRTG